MISYRVYIVDDEQTIREGISMALEDEFETASFVTAEDAIETMKDNPPDLILLDIGLPGMSGLEALRKIKESYPDILIIMITAFEDIETVISSMKQGAYDYVVKPLHMDGLKVSIQNALETIKLRKEVKVLQERYLTENLPCFIGESNAIHDVMGFMEMVAQSPDTPILILGETGTGKELIASAVHYRSPNFKGPLVTVNCAAIPKELIESELFGYEKGAFSGARASGKKGLIEESENGTLFLDEVSDLSLEAQAKLLRFLESGEFYRVGGTKKLHIQTRVVSATNKNIEKIMDKDLFRKDLYFRLGVIKIRIPSLNERIDDIVPLAKHFLYEYSRKFKKDIKGLSAQAERALLKHNWTGNVRELKNLIERGVLIGNGPELSLQDLDIRSFNAQENSKKTADDYGFLPLPPHGIDLPAVEKSLEKYYIEAAFQMAKGNESKAAQLLNINHHTYRYRRKKLFNE